MAAPTADTVLLQRYRLTAPVADRGLGETWEGDDARIEGRRVLVKLLDPCPDDARKAVLAQLQNLRMFRHPGALAVTDHGVHEGRPFVVHDLPLAGSLATLLDRHRAGELELPLDRVAALVARVAEVLQAGHEEPQPLVHGALRPRAVLVPDDLDAAKAVLLDAGLRDLARDPEAPKESAAAARCLTPEQFAGEETAPRTDTFALGLLVLELLRAPHGGVTQGVARYLGRPDVPDAVWEAVLLATRIPVAERPSTEAFADLLRPAWLAPPLVEPTATLDIPTPPAAASAPDDAHAPDDASALEDPPRYVPRSSIPPGGLLGAMPSLATPPLATAGGDEPVDLGERTVALEQAPGLAGYAPPADPLGSTQTMGARLHAEVNDTAEFAGERTIVAFSARMQAVDDMLSTVERALPPELDDVAARFRAQMAASRRREEPGRGGLSVGAPRRPVEGAPEGAPAPAAEAPRPLPMALIAAVVAVVVAAIIAVAARH